MGIKEKAKEAIEAYMEEHNLSTQALAKKSGVSPHTLAAILRCDNYNVDKLQKVLKTIGVDL